MRIVLVSDTHGYHDLTTVPDGDVLVHAGDLCRHGDLEDVEDFNRWLGTLPHPHKVVICGNHDWCFQTEPAEARKRLTNATYLQDSGCEIGGLTFYGTPWTPLFFDWAFMLSDAELAAKWARIPDRVDVLITHGPPHGILDVTNRDEHAGSMTLFDRVSKVRPRLHVFGHIHEAAGRFEHDGTTFLNASTKMGRGEAALWSNSPRSGGRKPPVVLRLELDSRSHGVPRPPLCPLGVPWFCGLNSIRGATGGLRPPLRFTTFVAAPCSASSA